MTPEDAITVTKIMLTADHWCSTCQNNLLDLLRRAFPEHIDVINATAARSTELEEAVGAAQDRWFDSCEGPEPTVLDVGLSQNPQ
jgi:hypothetical protein